MRVRVLALVAILAATTIGCNRQSDPPKYKAVTPERIQLQQGGTVRIVPGGKLGNGISEKHTVYPNGDEGHVFYRNDNETVRAVRENYANGELKSEATYGNDGKEVKHGEVKRPDGSLYLVSDLNDDGSRHIVFYNAKNQKQAFRQWAADGASYVDSYFRADGSVVGRVKTLYDGKQTVEAWHDVFPNGEQKVRIRIEFMQGGRKVIFFNAQDKKDYAQLWRDATTYEQDAFSYQRLEQVEEYDYNETVSRTLYFKEEKNTLTLLGAASLEYQYPPPPKPGFTTRHFVIEGTDMVKKDIEKREQTDWDWSVRPPVQKKREIKRIFQQGPLSKVVKPDGSTETHSTVGATLEMVNIARLKTFTNNNVLDTVRYEFNRSDKTFLGAPDANDPCRWYFRKSN